jgi:hypothetical protein
MSRQEDVSGDEYFDAMTRGPLDVSRSVNFVKGEHIIMKKTPGFIFNQSEVSLPCLTC